MSLNVSNSGQPLDNDFKIFCLFVLNDTKIRDFTKIFGKEKEKFRNHFPRAIRNSNFYLSCLMTFG